MKNNFVLLADHLAGVLRNLPIIFIITFVILIAPSAPAQNVELVSNLELGPCLSLGVAGSYAFVVGAFQYLWVVDISDPQSPHLESYGGLPGGSACIALENEYAYTANGNSGLKIVNIENPSSPWVAGSFQSDGYARSLFVKSRKVYLIDLHWPSFDMKIIDTSIPGYPVLLGQCDIGFASDISVSDNFAYVAGYDSLMIIDVSDPYNPVMISAVETQDEDDRFFAILTSGNYAFLAAEWNGLQVFDINNSLEPEFLTDYDIPGASRGICGDSNFVYTLGWHGIHFFDVSQPGNPLFAGTYDCPLEGRAAVRNGDYVFLTSGEESFLVLRYTPGRGFIRGVIRDDQTLEPIESAIVTAIPDSFTDVSSVDGEYILDSLLNINYDLSFSNFYYFDTTINAVTVLAADTVVVDVTMRHRPATDVGVTAIIAPRSPLSVDEEYAIICQVTNIGTQSQFVSAGVQISVRDSSEIIFSDFSETIELPALGVDSITFPNTFRPALETDYLITAFTSLQGDENRENDSCAAVFKCFGPFYLIFGNRDGSLMFGQPGQVIDMNIWGTTPGNDFPDSIIFMHIPLASNDSIVAERLGGYFPDTLVGNWDDVSFLTPDFNSPQPGWTNQSLLGFDCLIDPCQPQNYFRTHGDTILIATYRMRLSDNPGLLGNTYCPFQEGYNLLNGGPLWGDEEGLDGYIPIATYPCLYFPPPCDYLLGDVNSDGIANGVDVMFSVNYFKYGGGPPLDSCNCSPIAFPFFAAGDVNGSCSFNGVDILYMVNYYKGIVPPFDACDYCPPGSNVSMRSWPSLNPEYHAPALKPGLKKKQELE